MIKKLERKIQWTIFLILTVTAVGIFLTVNITNYQSLVKQEILYLQRLGTDIKPPASENSPKQDFRPSDSSQPEPENPSDVFHAFYSAYLVQMDNSGQITIAMDGADISYTEEQIASVAEDIFSSKEREGMHGNLRFLVKILPDKKEIVLLESQAKNRFFSSFVRTLLVGFVLMAVFFLAAKLLSRKIVRPVQETFSRQKQFISDASHELKTPITVINANIDLLRSEVGESKWMDYIESEGQRMSSLISNLLTLSRIDTDVPSGDDSLYFCDFDLSSAVLGIALSFESVAFERKVTYDVDITEDISYRGNESEIRQLTAILLDNAMKYTSENGCVRITLTRCKTQEGAMASLRRRSHYSICLMVSNTGQEIPKDEQKKIFERFYRTDKSRTRASGGFGLGLAIAKSIVEKHCGEIGLACHNGQTVFTVKL